MKKDAGNGTKSFGYFSVLEYTSTVYCMLMSLLLYLLFLLFPPLCIASQHWKALFDQVCEQLMYCLCLVSKDSNPQLISSVLDFPAFRIQPRSNVLHAPSSQDAGVQVTTALGLSLNSSSE